MNYRVAFSLEARRAPCRTVPLYRCGGIGRNCLPFQYTEAIVSYCESLRTFPLRGTPRGDVRPGLRITNYKKRAVIAFDVESERVSIIGIFYGGKNYESILRDDDNGTGH